MNQFFLSFFAVANVFATLFILYRTIVIASSFGMVGYTGKKTNYFLMTFAYALMSGGALFSIGDWDMSDSILTIGIALFLYASRRGKCGNVRR